VLFCRPLLPVEISARGSVAGIMPAFYPADRGSIPGAGNSG